MSIVKDLFTPNQDARSIKVGLYFSPEKQPRTAQKCSKSFVYLCFALAILFPFPSIV